MLHDKVLGSFPRRIEGGTLFWLGVGFVTLKVTFGL